MMKPSAVRAGAAASAAATKARMANVLREVLGMLMVSSVGKPAFSSDIP